MRLSILVIFLIAVPGWADDPASGESASSAEIIDRYVTAVGVQKSNPQNVSMEVDIDAELPRLKKTGRLHALRFISKVGQIFYRFPRFEGDNTVKKEVIARYLRAESEAKNEYAGSIAITPANYKFKYKGVTDYAGRSAHVFQLTPRKKRIGLFKGELWVDSETFLPLREWGELVKNPSVFLRRVYFVRDYHIYDRVSVPRRIISNVDTRIVGRASLTIWFDKVNIGVADDDTAQVAGAGAGSAARLLPGGSQH